MEHRNGAHKHPIDARKLPNATQKLPDDTCMRLKGYMVSSETHCNQIAIAPPPDCNCAAMPQVQPDCNCMQPDCNCSAMQYNWTASTLKCTATGMRLHRNRTVIALQCLKCSRTAVACNQTAIAVTCITIGLQVHCNQIAIAPQPDCNCDAMPQVQPAGLQLHANRLQLQCNALQLQCNALQLDCKCTEMHCNQIAIALPPDCNCAAMRLNQTCASRDIWWAVCNKTTLPKKVHWARRNTRSVQNYHQSGGSGGWLS